MLSWHFSQGDGLTMARHRHIGCENGAIARLDPRQRTHMATTISRHDLYRRVWDTPMRKLAAEFAISDVGLAKVCRKHDIPVPPVGYWAKVAHGKPITRPALPPHPAQSISFDGQSDALARKPTRVPAKEFSVRPWVPVDLDSLAPFAAATHRALTKAKPTEKGLVTSGSATTMPCAVSPESVARAVRLLDAVERALPSVAARFFHDRANGRVGVQVADEQVSFTLTEDTKRSETLIRHPRYEYLNRREYTYTSTGQLQLRIDADFVGRRTWSDGKRQLLENKLAGFVVGLVEAARGVTQLRAEREAARLKREADAERWRVDQEALRKRQQFIEQLDKEADAWTQATALRRYVDVLQAEVARAGVPLSASGQAWLALACELAASTNPLPVRVTQLTEDVDAPEWYLPFGRPIIT